MNNGVFDGSSKMYADPSTKSHHNEDVEMGHGGPGPYSMDKFAKDADNVKEPEKLYVRIEESNEDVKVSQNAMGMRELRDDVDADLDRRQLIESRYTREKATTEASAMQDRGRGPCLDVASEIQELRGSMMEIRRSLMALHQGLLGITSPVVAVTLAEERPIEGGPPSPILDTFSPPVGGLPVVEKRTDPKELNDYKKECHDHADMIFGGIVGIFFGAVLMFMIVDIYLEYRFNGKGFGK